MERVAGAGARGVAGMGVFGRGAGVLSEAAQSQTAKNVLEQLAAKPMQQTGGALAGNVAGEAVKEGGAGPGGQLAANLAANVAFPATAQMGAAAAGKATDLVKGKLPVLQAADIANRSAGADRAAIVAALENAKPGDTAAQAAAGVKSDLWSALGDFAKRADTTSGYSRQAADQVAGRVSSLEAVKPDLARSVDARESASTPLYRAARGAGDVVDASGIAKKIDDLIERNPGNPELLREMSRLKSGLYDADENIRVNAEQIASVMDGLKASIANKENKFILNQLVSIKDDLANAIPGYKQAQDTFATMSKPVNQSQVLGEMLSTLEKPGGGERAAPFLGVLGRGEEAMLKRSTGYPRYESGDLPGVLSGRGQMAAVNKVAAELERDASIKSGAAAGAGGFERVLGENLAQFKLPNWINAKIAVTNRALSELEQRVNKKTIDIVVEGMRSGKTALEVMQALPAKERITVLKVLADQQIKPYMTGGVVSGLLSQPQGILSQQYPAGVLGQ